jgi:hypothetical protein
LATWKCDSSKVYETLRSRVSCFQLDTISIMATWKKVFLIVLRPSAQGYVANC